MQKDSQSTNNLNQNAKQINRQTSFHSSSNPSSITAIQDLATQPNSVNIIIEFSGGENDSLRPRERELNWWIQNLNLYNGISVITPQAQIIISLDALNKGWEAS